MEINLTNIYKKYKGLWVVLNDAFEVVTSNKSAKKAYDEALKKGYKKPALFKIPSENTAYVG